MPAAATASENAAAPPLACRGLRKVYGVGGKSIVVLSDVNFSVAAGESVAIVGASGSGKTTLLHLLGGLDSPSGGEVLVGGRRWLDMSDWEVSRWRNRHLGFVFQFHLLLAEFSAIENVAMPLLLRRESRGAAMSAAAACLRAVGMSAHEGKTPDKLSGGERQRVAVARALCGSPRCILADEPTGNLDADNVRQVFELLLSACDERRTALVVVSHDSALTRQTTRQQTLSNGILSNGILTP